MLHTGVGATENPGRVQLCRNHRGEIKCFCLELKFEMDFRYPNHINHYLKTLKQFYIEL